MNPKVDMDKPGVVVIGPNVWGKGQDIKTAICNAGGPKQYIVYAIPFGLRHVWVDDVCGSLQWSGTEAFSVCKPFEIMRKGFKKGNKV